MGFEFSDRSKDLQLRISKFFSNSDISNILLFIKIFK